MHYTLDEIRTFLAVMEHGAVTQAAARLNLSKSVVSKQIRDLETGLGVALFRRNAGRILPTEAALHLTERMTPAIAELTAAAESAAWAGAGRADAPLRGRLTLSLPMTFGVKHLSAMVAVFAQKHPELELRVDYDDRPRDLARDGFDLAVRVGHSAGLSLTGRKICEDRRFAVASPAFLAAHGPLDEPEDLQGLPAIGYSHLPMSELWVMERDGRKVTAGVVEHHSVNNGEALAEMAAEGLGVAMLPGFVVAEAIAAGRLVPILCRWQMRRLPIMALWPPVSPLPLKIRAFLDALLAELGREPPWLRGLDLPALGLDE